MMSTQVNKQIFLEVALDHRKKRISPTEVLP